MSASSQPKAETSILTDPVAFARVMADVQARVQPLMVRLMDSAGMDDGQDRRLDPLNIAPAYIQFVSRLWQEPQKLAAMQEDFIRNWMNLCHESAKKFMGLPGQTLYPPEQGDRRFRDDAWRDSAFFDFIKQSYLLTSRHLADLVKSPEGLDAETRQKVDFLMRQWIDALSPTNFLFTNPEVIRETIHSNGDNLVRGLEHLIADMERGRGALDISTTDHKAFEVGRNLAITPGKVIFRNDLLELIQYAPTTEKVFATPLLIVPPWVNKYYILDLQPENSLVKWLVDKGHSVFMISWVNPGPQHAHKQFEDYMRDGLLEAMRTAQEVCEAPSVNLMGYCLGGTLAAMTLAWLAKKGRQAEVRSATFLTTLIDFENAGDLKLFMTDSQLESMEEDMTQRGYLSADSFRRTFALLRANDMVWSFVINNYLMGREPFPFDLLHWNDDATNMPAAMHSFYLRKLYRENLLARPDGLTINGEKLDVTKIRTPCYFLSTKEDHIAPWKSTYDGAQLLTGPVKFVLAASGHVAGVVNPPDREKYFYWTSEAKSPAAEEWLGQAVKKSGSWWTDWTQWIAASKDATIAARKVTKSGLENAPGLFVKILSHIS